MVTPAPPNRRFLSQSDKLGKYEVIRQIAVGGMAELYLARTEMEGFEKLVCVKRILPQYIDNPTFVNMFLNEARLAATLHHPNIAQVYDIGQEHGEFFFAMEYVHGEDLGRLVATARDSGVAISPDCALTLVSGLCAGLHHAHEKASAEGKPLGVVHRDVSPTNVLVSYDGAVKLVDFGIARASGDVASSPSGLKGKISYMSPEQCRGKVALDRRSDVFSVGTILYELTTGRRPFTDETEYGVLQQIVSRDADPPSTVVPGYPPALEAIVMRAMSRDVNQRFSTALELQNHLEDFAHDNRLRVSPLVVARLMSTLFPARLEEWDHARAQGAFFVEQHVVRTLIESGRTPDTAQRTAQSPAVDDPDGAASGEAATVPAAWNAGQAAAQGEAPTVPARWGAAQGEASTAPGGWGASQGEAPTVPAGRGSTPVPVVQAATQIGPPPVAHPRPGTPLPVGPPMTAPAPGMLAPAGPPMTTPPPGALGRASPPPGSMAAMAAMVPPPVGSAMTTPAPGALGRASTPRPVATALSQPRLPTPQPVPQAATPQPQPAHGRYAQMPVPNHPGAVPIVTPMLAPPIASAGTLVSSALQAGTSAATAAGAGSSPGMTGGMPGGMTAGMTGMAAMGYVPAAAGDFGASDTASRKAASLGYAGYGPPVGLGDASGAGGLAPHAQVATAAASPPPRRSEARPTLIVRVRPRRWLPFALVAGIGAIGAVAVALLFNDSAASQAQSSSAPVPAAVEAAPSPSATGAASPTAAAGAAGTAAGAAGTAAGAAEDVAKPAAAGAAAGTSAAGEAGKAAVAGVAAGGGPAADEAGKPTAAGNAAGAAQPPPPTRAAASALPTTAIAPPSLTTGTASPAAKTVAPAALLPATGAADPKADAARKRTAKLVAPDPRKPAKQRPRPDAKRVDPRRAAKSDVKEQTWNDDSPFMPVQAAPKR